VAVRSAFLRLILVALLLVAQHAALTHAIWHGHDDASSTRQLHAGESDAGSDRAPEQGLCAFHVALGQVLGGSNGSACHFYSPELASELIAQSARPYSVVLSLPFHSRAPPVLL
jgi:hypothetical protein